MAVDTLLARLEKVKATGPNRWQACCPAHDDKTPSLAVCEMDDGRILVHCFGGCGASDVVAALGLELSDLMPAPTEPYLKPTRRAFTEGEALRCLASESAILAIAISDLADGIAPSATDADRICEASGKIKNALEYVYGHN